MNGFVKFSTILCKFLIKNSSHPVVIGYVYRKKRVGQIQNIFIAKTRTPS